MSRVRTACADVNVYLLMAPWSIYFEFGEVGQRNREFAEIQHSAAEVEGAGFFEEDEQIGRLFGADADWGSARR